MIQAKYGGASSDFVFLENFFGTLEDISNVQYPAASDDQQVLKPCLPGDETCYEVRCNVTTLTTVVFTPKNYDGCIQVNGDGNDKDDFLLATCDASNPRQRFNMDDENHQMKLSLDTTKCLQAGHGNSVPKHGTFLRVFPCDTTVSQQNFTWKGGALMLEQFGLAVVFQGAEANVDSDHIIVGDIDKASVLKRKDWVVFN